MKAELWDQLKAELWREGQGVNVSHGAVDTPSTIAARDMYDRMLLMEAFSGVRTELRGRGVDALLAGRGV